MMTLELLTLFRRELELCKVSPGEVVAVLTGPNSRPDYASAFVAAARQLGAEVFRLDLPAAAQDASQTPTTAQGALWGRTPLTGHRSGVDILKRVDMLVDLVGLLHSPEQ
ncbi:MAG: leucyl aminopeptidase, partial [Bradyrhizobium sp.]